MRRLVLLRHARSEAESKGKGDHARALDEHGRHDALALGSRLRELGVAPQVVTSSDATRTRETWACMCDALGGAPRVTFTSTLYLMGIAEIRAALRGVEPAIDTVLVIGHNPGWEDAVYALSGVRARMVPCAAVVLQTTADHWAAALGRSDWTFDRLLHPDARPSS